MKKAQEIRKHIDRAVGTEGTLRIPSWWMRKILTDIVKFCEEKADNDALDYFKSYVNEQLTILCDQDVSLLDKLDNTNSRVSALESKQLFVILNSLPEKGIENKIYLIPNLNGEDKNVLTEWAWINETWEQFGEFKPEIDLTPYMVNITYNELVTLRDNAQLIPGQQYRITDYVTNTIQENTQSAGHQFDIIVTADDESTLNEEARACLHEGDTYFSEAGANLSAWKVWYCLDNDTDRFAWADATNGKGVIYRMIDEFNNECPYDFKNIQFARWELSNPVGYRNDYDFDNYENNWIQEETPFDSLKTGFYGLDGSSNAFTYVYNEDEEYYKYKVEYTISESPTYCYTFGKDTDYSMNVNNYGNIIKEYKGRNKIQLNNIVFLSSCYNNSFGNGCSDNSFGNGCSNNSFGNGCYDNSFGNNYNNNSFGNYCYSNSFGNSCTDNSFGNGCYDNSFGNNYNNNSFGNYCYSNSFGNNCYSNSFGNYCSSNSFGNNCYNNSFESDCHDNSFRTNNSITATLLNYCRYNHFDDGCSYNIVYNTTTTGSNNQLQNVNINRGVSGTFSKYNTVSIDTLNANYEIKVAKNSSGAIKIYCEADLIA